jgi:hypothetical protein
VGLPRESIISSALMESITDIPRPHLIPIVE